MAIRHRNLILAVAAGYLTLSPALALAQVSEGSVLGTSMLEVLTGLEQQGYRVVELELKRDHIEAEAILDNQRYEIEVDLQTGRVRDIDLED